LMFIVAVIAIIMLCRPTFGIQEPTKDLYPQINQEQINQEQAKDVNSLLKDLKSNNPMIREYAKTLLYEKAIQHSRDITSAVEPLIQDLKDNDSQVRLSAVDILGMIGDTRAVEPLIQVLKTNYNVNGFTDDGRPCAAIALGYINDTRAVEPLIQSLNDNHASIRLCAAQALGMIETTRAVEPLINALKDDNWFVRLSASLALGMINDARAIEPLIPLLKDDNDIVRNHIEIALRNLGWQEGGSKGNVPYDESHLVTLGASQTDNTGKETCGCIPDSYEGLICPIGIR
jgi:HEAT repeat protein